MSTSTNELPLESDQYPATDDVGTIRNWNVAPPWFEASGAEAAVLNGLNRSDPTTASRLRAAVSQFPAIGSEFAGFRLLGSLGSGTFGRVYLAQQGDLADRYVALKVSADLVDESRALARLQHTNIVPIFSVHHAGALQAVCMPFLGTNTLAHVLKRFRGTTLVPTSGRQLLDTLSDLSGETDLTPLGPRTGLRGEVPTDPLDPASAARDLLSESSPFRTGGFVKLLSESSYPDAVCWIVSRLADGLAHAHAHGIIHNDLKPANVLLADDGQPMLLDFGVAEDWKLRATATGGAIGGTLPYMSPEQLNSVRDRRPATDPRSDIYALGILLYEMLTGHYPFRLPTGSFEEELPRIIAERRVAPPRLRQLNPGVSPGLEAIARKCLHPDPGQRYQTATDLRDELERHRTGLPLVHTRVPSVRERLRKWSGRHPLLSSNLTLGSAAAVVIALCGVGLYSRDARLTRQQALSVSRELDDTVRSAHYELSTRTPEASAVVAGIDKASAALALYNLPGDPNWESHPQFKSLPPDEQAHVRDRLREACLLLARGYANQAGAGQKDEGKLAAAVELNGLAERIGGVAPRAVWEQRSELFRLAGNASGASTAAGRAKDAPLLTAQDFFLSGSQAIAEGKYREAIRLFTHAAELDPAHYWTHMNLGISYESLALQNEAIGHYTAAIALRPDSEWGYYSRGLVLLRCREFRRAKADLDKVVAMNPDKPDVYMNRAVAFQGLREFDNALADLETALDKGAPRTRVVLMRSRVRDLAGDRAGAQHDLAEGMKSDPTDEIGWTTRGTARLNLDPAGAVRDFDAALGLNPRSLVAGQNKATGLSKLGRHLEAIKTLDRVVEEYPDFVPARIARGVQHAREGNVAAAEADAAESLKRDTGPVTLYQAANIYALLCRKDPTKKAAAVNHLTAALRGGFGYEHIETDKDLDPIRTTPEFKKVLESTRTLNALVR
jgi:serine/threonine protein kinase/tetratricopeptide (TPR) repeat protein